MDDLEKMTRLRGARSYAKALTNKAYQDYQKANEVAKKLYNELERQRTNYEEIDLELAEIDGRLIVIQAKVPRKVKKIEPAVLTIDQIKDIAEKMGIVLDLGEECNLD